MQKSMKATSTCWKIKLTILSMFTQSYVTEIMHSLCKQTEPNS